jgi:hypothetical protein
MAPTGPRLTKSRNPVFAFPPLAAPAIRRGMRPRPVHVFPALSRYYTATFPARFSAARVDASEAPPYQRRPLAEKRRDCAKTAVRLLIEPVTSKIPLDPDQEQLVAHVLPVASGPSRVVPLTDLGDIEKATVRGLYVGHISLECTINHGEIRPAAQFG